jgi:hypothetical protein
MTQEEREEKNRQISEHLEKLFETPAFADVKTIFSYRDRVGEIFVDIGKIGIVHVREKVSYGSAFLKRNRSEIRLCNVAAPASEHIETIVMLQKLNS